MRARMAIVASVTLVSLTAGCGNNSTSTTKPTTTPPSTTSTTVAGSTTTTAPPAIPTDSAVWPFVTSTTRYADPVKAATEFAVTYLGFVSPSVGPFMGGDSRSGEV